MALQANPADLVAGNRLALLTSWLWARRATDCSIPRYILTEVTCRVALRLCASPMRSVYFKEVAPAGFEPATRALKVHCSAS